MWCTTTVLYKADDVHCTLYRRERMDRKELFEKFRHMINNLIKFLECKIFNSWKWSEREIYPSFWGNIQTFFICLLSPFDVKPFLNINQIDWKIPFSWTTETVYQNQPFSATIARLFIFKTLPTLNISGSFPKCCRLQHQSDSEITLQWAWILRKRDPCE